jgi:hypothetical protein
MAKKNKRNLIKLESTVLGPNGKKSAYFLVRSGLSRKVIPKAQIGGKKPLKKELLLKKFNPMTRRHELFKETRLK